MPLYSYSVLDAEGNKTAEQFEEIYKAGKAPDMLRCTDGRIAKRDVSLIAKTILRWGDSHKVWNQSLGEYISSSADVDRICRERGLVPEDDLPKGTEQKFLEREKAHHEYWEKDALKWDAAVNKYNAFDETTNQYNDNVMHHVWEEYLPAKQLLNDASTAANKTAITDF